MRAFRLRAVCGLLLGIAMLGTSTMVSAQTPAAAPLSPAPPVSSGARPVPALPEAGARLPAIPMDDSARPGPSTGRGPA